MREGYDQHAGDDEPKFEGLKHVARKYLNRGKYDARFPEATDKLPTYALVDVGLSTRFYTLEELRYRLEQVAQMRQALFWLITVTAATLVVNIVALIYMIIVIW